jgi:predicted HicB family RNase H-like nuclease
MKYKGYYAVVKYDTFDRIYHGKIADIKDLVSFHSETEEGLQVAFEEAVDDYLNLIIQL